MTSRSFKVIGSEMEAENKLYIDMHGVGQGQPAPDPPNYTPTPQQQQQPQGQFQGYPPYGQSTVAASPYYAPPSGAGYGVPPPPQQQQQVVVVGTNQSPIVHVQPVQSFAGAIIYSCFVFWCCGGVFGLIAFILALIASDKAATDAQVARNLGRASYIVSSVGIVVAIVFIAVYFGVFFGSCRYSYNGVCYRHYSPDMSPDECSERNGVYVDGGCFYN